MISPSSEAAELRLTVADLAASDAARDLRRLAAKRADADYEGDRLRRGAVPQDPPDARRLDAGGHRQCNGAARPVAGHAA